MKKMIQQFASKVLIPCTYACSNLHGVKQSVSFTIFNEFCLQSNRLQQRQKKANDNSLLSLIRYQHLNSLLQTTFQPDSIKHSLRQELLVSKRQCRQEVSSLFGEIGNFVTIWRIIVAYLLPRKVHLVYEVPFYTLGSVDKKISICLQENPHQ